MLAFPTRRGPAAHGRNPWGQGEMETPGEGEYPAGSQPFVRDVVSHVTSRVSLYSPGPGGAPAGASNQLPASLRGDVTGTGLRCRSPRLPPGADRRAEVRAPAADHQGRRLVVE